MWEMFDFGHEASIKELQVMNRLFKETDEEKNRLAVKILLAVAR